jgi:hypothetical protein
MSIFLFLNGSTESINHTHLDIIPRTTSMSRRSGAISRSGGAGAALRRRDGPVARTVDWPFWPFRRRAVEDRAGRRADRGGLDLVRLRAGRHPRSLVGAPPWWHAGVGKVAAAAVVRGASDLNFWSRRWCSGCDANWRSCWACAKPVQAGGRRSGGSAAPHRTVGVRSGDGLRWWCGHNWIRNMLRISTVLTVFKYRIISYELADNWISALKIDLFHRYHQT